MVDYKNLKDLELLELLRHSSDHSAYAELYHRYFILLRRFVLRFQVDEGVAGDIAQDVLLDLWERREQIEVRKKLASFLFRSAFHHVLNKYRREKVVAAFEENFRLHYTEAYSSTEDIISTKEINDVVNSAIDQMKPKMKLVFTSSRFENMDTMEISKEYGIPRDTVKHQIKGALSILRRMGLRLHSFFL